MLAEFIRHSALEEVHINLAMTIDQLRLEGRTQSASFLRSVRQRAVEAEKQLRRLATSPLQRSANRCKLNVEPVSAIKRRTGHRGTAIRRDGENVKLLSCSTA